MLEIKNLTVKVKNDTPILTDVSLSIDEGTCIGLTGASGSGKTTLIKSIMGMNSGDLEIAQGQILLDGDNLLIHPRFYPCNGHYHCDVFLRLEDWSAGLLGDCAVFAL